MNFETYKKREKGLHSAYSASVFLGGACLTAAIGFLVARPLADFAGTFAFVMLTALFFGASFKAKKELKKLRKNSGYLVNEDDEIFLAKPNFKKAILLMVLFGIPVFLLGLYGYLMIMR